MTVSMPSPRFDLADAGWLAHRHVESTDTLRFIPVARAEHAEIAFLTDDALGPRPTHDVPLAEALAALPKAPMRLLFHSAFCGSTLLVRALAQPGAAMGLSEPVLLNDVVGLRRRGARPAAVARCADAALRALGRPFAPGEAVVVKPSNVINPLAELLLALAPEAKALFLHAPLESFLISVVRKGLPCRLWVRELAAGYLPEGLFAPLGLEADDLFRQSDLQVAASGWLAQHRLFSALAGRLGPDRLRTLDSETLTSSPEAALAGVAAHFGLALDAAAAAAGPAFARHSKSGAAFTPKQRGAEYAEARALHGEEIGAVLAWATELASRAGIAFDAPHAVVQP